MLPLPNLDDKTFDQLTEDAKKWISRYAPGWTDHHIHDPGITLIELFAWLTEIQHFYLDQVREESELKFLKLLGTQPQDMKPAMADVTFHWTDQPKDHLEIPAGTPLAAGDLQFETTEALTVVSSRLAKVICQNRYGISDQSDANQRGGLPYEPFGKEAEAGSALYLGFDRLLPPGAELPLTVRLFEDYPVKPGQSTGTDDVPQPSARIAWQYYASGETEGWKPLKVVSDGTRMLSESGKVRFIAPENMMARTLLPVVSEPYYWIRAIVIEPGYELPPRVDRVLLNTVAASQTETRSESLGKSNGLPHQFFRLSRFPVIPDSLILQVKEQTPEGETWMNWQRVDSLEASLPTDRHYVLEPETGTIRFGDGRSGAIPPARETEGEDGIRVPVYQVTAADYGNVGAGAIQSLVNAAGDLKRIAVTNRLPAAGGKRRETLEEAKFRMRQEISESGRAVTTEDFEQLAKGTPGLRVARAKAIPLVGKNGREEPGAVTVVVVPYSEYRNPRPGTAFLQNVCRHLDRHRLIATRLYVVPPEYVRISVDAVVQVKAGFQAQATQTKVVDRLLAFLHPLLGGADGTGWPFGRSVYRSEVYEAIAEVEGVGCITSLRITGSGPAVAQDREGNLMLSPTSLVYSDAHNIETVIEDTVCSDQGGCHGC